MHMTEPGCRSNPVEVARDAKSPMFIESYGYRPGQWWSRSASRGSRGRSPRTGSRLRRRDLPCLQDENKPWAIRRWE